MRVCAEEYMCELPLLSVHFVFLHSLSSLSLSLSLSLFGFDAQLHHSLVSLSHRPLTVCLHHTAFIHYLDVHNDKPVYVYVTHLKLISTIGREWP